MSPAWWSRTPSQHAQATGLAQIFQAAGDQIIYEGGEPYRWAQWPAPAAPAAAEVQPSELLRAANAVIDFTGRDALLEELRAWREGSGPTPARQNGVAVELVHGQGGQGKTRLAGHLADLWQGEGWVALSAHHRRDRSVPKSFAVPDMEQAAGVLVVVDYAERWDTTDLLTLLGDTLIPERLPVRVLLLARPSGTWWQSLHGRIQRDLRVTASSRELKPLESEAGITRHSLFAAARDRFADLLQRPAARQVDPPEALERHEAYQLVLTVQMAALAAVLTHGQDGQDPPTDPVQVSQVLLARERDHWEAMAAPRRENPLATSPEAMGQLVYTATLTGRLGYTDGGTALESAAIESREHPGQLLKDHAVCYPPSTTFSTPHLALAAAGDGEATVLEPLYPDRLGEDFLALSTPGHPHDFPTDAWAAGAPARLLTTPSHANEPVADSGVVPVWIRHGLITLIEASQRWIHLAQQQLYPLLTARPDLALHAGGAALAGLADLDDIDQGLLERIESVLPTHRHIDLGIGIAAVAVRLAEHRLPKADLPGRARIYDTLARHLAHAGLHARALAEGQRATRIWRQLTELNRAAYLPDLARSLHNYAIQLAETGQREEAVPISEEAVTLRRVLAALNRKAYLPGLATSLDNHAVRLIETGQREEAVPVSEEATHLYGELVERDRAAYLPGLANSLNSHAASLAVTGRREEAVPIIARAVALRRELAALNRAAHLPDLAASLNNYALWLAETGQREEAVPISEETVALRRELAELNRAAYLPDLAASLHNHAIRLAETGQREEAVPISEEAVALRRELADLNRAAYLPDLAMSLNNHAALLTETGQWEEAVPISEEAVRQYVELAKLNRAAYLPNLAASLNNHATHLAETGRREEALPINKEAVHQYVELAKLNRAAYLPGYIQSLTTQGHLLVEEAQFREATVPLTEAFIAWQHLSGYAQGIKGIVGAIIGLLGRAYAGDTEGVSEAFREVTGQDFPDWMKQPPESEG